MVIDRRLRWQRTALDLPLGLLVVLVLGQLALGNGPLVRWALAPPGAPDSLPSLFIALGTVAPAHTARALLLLLTYAGAYVLVVNLVRTRAHLDRLVGTLLTLGGFLGFLALLDHLGGAGWLLRWRGPGTGRLSGTFVNADHFAAWLSMLICLGIGSLLGRRGAGGGAAVARLLGSREGRERLVREHLPFLAVLTMSLALIFTLSRGAMISLLLAVLILLPLLHAVGRIRRSLAVIGALLIAVLGYGTWIGLGPLLARAHVAGFEARLLQGLTSLPMLGTFPILGVGLGAYGDIYSRYQPLALEAGKIAYPYAHDDLLQLVLELGVVGGAVCLWMGWRVGADLIGAHLLGRADCPVGGGEREGARRRDPFSVGLGIGAAGSVVALLVHSGLDFAARIPANGILGAACLGIATVALHTRFQPTGERALVGSRDLSLIGRPGLAVAVAAGGIVILLSVVALIVRPPLVTARIAAAERARTDRQAAIGWLDAALRLDPRDERALALRGRLRLDALVRLSNSGVTLDGRLLTEADERRRAGLALADEAFQDFTYALVQVPSDSRLHDGRARALWAQALLDPAGAQRDLAGALASFSRAAALAPESPFPYWTLAVFAVPQGGSYTEVGLRAAERAVALDPAMLGDLVDQLLPARLSGAQWVELAPRAATDRAELALALQERSLSAEGIQAFRSALEIAPADQRSFFRWVLARALLQERRPREALAVIQDATAEETTNPELLLVRGDVLAALGDADALTAYRLAVLRAEIPPEPRGQPFGPLPQRLRALVERVLGRSAGPDRYHRALARYLTGRGAWEQAVAEWDVVLASNPGDAEGHFLRGTALDGLGARDRALEAYRQAVALDGTSRAYRLRLAQRLWETEQYYQAINEWRSVLGQEPGNIEARLGLARAAAKAGDRTAAAQEYRHILQIVPDQPEARRELARLVRAPAP